MKRIIQKHHIRKIKHITAISAVTFFVAIFSYIFLPSQAAFNKQINYQGKLSASSGVAVANGTYNMEFKLYTASSGGSAIWTETRINANRVTVTNGLFSIMLGEVSPLTGVDFNQTLYLGVNIGGTAVSPSWDGEMSPRKILGVVPAAVESERTGGFIPSQTPTGNNIPVLSAGNLTLTGSINAPTFQGNAAAVTFGNGTYGTTIAGNSLTVSPTSWTATPTISGLVTLTSGLTSNGTMTANGVVALGDGGDNITINSNNWSITGAGAISGVTTISLSGQITSNIATGTSPFSVTSTTVNTNLNADLLDGHSSSYFATDSSLNSYVPYTGASSNVNLGTYNLTTGSEIITKADSTALTDLLINPTAKTSGNFIDTQVNGVSKFVIDYKGYIGIGRGVSSIYALTMLGNQDGDVGASFKNNSTGANAYANNQFENNLGDAGYVGIGGGANTNSVFTRRTYLESYTGLGLSLVSDTGDIRLYTGGDTTTNERMRIDSVGNVGIGAISPTAVLHLKAGTATAGTAPLKLTAGTNLGATEAGAVEYDGSHLYFTAANGGSRYQLDQQGGTGANALGSYIVQAATNAPANSQVLASLGTGLIKNTTGTGVLSIASAGTDYQAPLVSGTNIKTINGSSVLGSGDLAITGMIYPSAGIPNSTGGAWGTSYTTSGSGTVLALTNSPVFTTPTLGAATATSINNLPLSQNNTDFNIFVGQDAGLNIVAGANKNTFIGYETGKSASSGINRNWASENTAIGYQSLYSNIEGWGNVSVGVQTLYANTTGYENTAIGYYSLSSNTTGWGNTANGEHALMLNTTGYLNTANGLESLKNNTTGNNNTAMGYDTLYYNVSNSRSTAIGYNAMYLSDNRVVGRNTYNTAVGYESLKGGGTPDINTGQYNTAIGDSALSSNTSGYDNTALGYNAGKYITNGSTLNSTSNNSLYLGYDTRASVDGNANEIVIGASTIGNGSNTVTIGSSSILRTYLIGLNLKAGTATAGTAPLKFTAGTNLGATEAGAVEYDGSHLYFTAVNGGTRYQLDQQSTGINTGDETTATIKTKLGAASTGADGYLTSTDWNTFNGKQASLVSGTNIKTINGSSVLGSGDLAITGMIYPSAGIAVSTGSAWTTSITDNSANWNTAYGWGNHASGGYVKTDQTSGQTIGTTGARLTKLWATDITVTNAITGSVTGSAGSVSGLTLTTNLTNNGGAGVLTWPAAGATLTIPTGGGTLGSNAFTSTAYLPSASFTDAAVTGKLITGFVSGAGTVAATDTILQAIQKLNGNIAANGNGTVTSVSTAAANNGVTATWSMASPTPALTIGLGAITPTSVNGLTLTAAATGFTIAGGTTSKTLTINNTLGFSGTDGSTLNIGTGGTLGTAAYTASTAYQPSNTNLTSLSGLTYASTSFVKMTAAGTFALDTNTYLTSASSLTAGNLTGTIPSAVLGNSTVYVGTTAIALNRASANLGLTGISSIALPGATSGTITLTPAATAGATAITIPATSGTLITTGDSGTVTGTMITNDTVALTTDTSGNYVASANTSALTGLTGGSAGSEGAGLTLGFSYATALSGDPALAANNIIFGTNGMIWEGSAADTFETYLAITNPTVDRTITIQDNSGVIPLGTAANTLFFTTTAATSVTLPTTGTLATLAGSEAFSNKTYNGLTITANGTNTLNIAAGKTLTVSNSIAIAGTDSTTMTFPTTSATIARTDAAQTFTGIQTFSGAITANGGINTAAATALNIVTGTTGALTLDTGTTGAINIGTDANAKTINIGNTGAAAKTILIGNSAQANTITIGSASATGVSITDNNWSINTTGAASFVSVNNLVLSQDNTDFNVKVGTNAGLNLVSGAQFNTFLGYEAGKSAAAGGTNAADWNTAVGYGAFSANTTGQANTANGFLSLASNTTGSANTASGIFSLNANMIGSANTANGIYSLGSNTADGNSAYGYYSLSTNTTGTANTAIGYEAGRYIANGSTSNLTSDYSVYLGSNTKAGADNNQNEIVIGYNAIGKGSNTVTLGNSSITGTYLNGDVSTTSRMFVGVTSEATSSSKLYVEGTTAADGSASAIAGILGGYTFNPTAGGVQVGNRFVVTNSPTTTANTAVGEIIRIVDNTSLANTVRGLDVTANGGGNSAGVNTGIRGSGSTFGIQGTTTALGGGLSVPAAIYGESTGTTQGDILRLYSNSVTSAPSFATFYHDTSAFTGTGLLMDFATGSGSFTGDFANFQKNSTSLFKVTNTGIVSLGLSSTASTSAVCSSLANGTSPTSGVSYELRDCSNTPVADYAEMYPVEEGIEYGDIVVTGKETVNTYDVGSDGGIDWTKIKGNVTKLVKSDEPYQGNVIGIVSDNHSDFSSVGYNIKNEDNPMPIALNGRVPVKVSLSSRAIKAGDYITTSDEKGKATKATKAGFVIGKALEDWSSSSGKNTVMMFVEQGYYNGISISDFAGISLDITQEGSDKIFSKQILEKLLEDEENAKINTSEILVDRLVAALGIITPSITTNTLSAEGEVEFGGLVFFNASASFAKEVKFDDVVEFNVPPLFNNDTAGFAIIKKGATTVDVTFDKPYIATPVVNTTITFEKNKEDTDQFNASDFFGEDLKFIVVDKDENGFTIMLNKVSQFDVSFSWTALAVKDPKIFESVIDGLVIEQESSAASEVASAIDTTNNTSTEGITPIVENSSDTTIIDEIINSNIIQNIIGGGDVSYTASDTEGGTTDQTSTVTDEVPSSPLVVDTEASSEVVSAPSSEPSTPSEPSQVSSPTVE